MNLKDTKLLASAGLIGILSVGVVGLGACGRFERTLDQPPPLFGEQAKADYAARRAAVDAAAADRAKGPVAAADQPDPEADNAPRTTRDVKDPAQENLPITQDPISGAPNLMGTTPSLKPPTR